jgi:signal transduction histidine kinase/tetratricopeptide (TPR) repeat protein
MTSATTKHDAALAGGSPREAAPPRTFAGRFRVERLLREGQGVETFLARDATDGAPVVLKVAPLARVGAGGRLRLEHEAEALRAAGSPALVRPIHLGAEGEALVLARPYLPGITLEERLSAGPPLAVEEALAIGRSLLEALGAAHASGVLHRDVRPGNVIVGEAAPIARVSLVDFGLARSIRAEASIREEPLRSARYASPEQAGLLEHGVDERSDLYSAGVLLFECLAGRPPFLGERLGEVLRQHLSARPPALRGLARGVPRALEDVIERLLRKDPRDRYQSAEGARADLAAIADALARGESDPAVVVGASDRRRTLTEPAFVGRADELAALDLGLARAREGRGELIFVEAESGGGKTWVLDELARRSAESGAWILRGRGLDQAAQRPFEVLAGVSAELLAAARTEPGLADAVRARLGEHREATCTALPELAEVLGPAPRELGPEAFGETRSLAALGALLDALGGRGRPAVVLLDDCQWADELTLKLLRDWRRREAPERYVAVVAAFRSEEVPPSHILRAIAPITRVSLPPLRPDEVRGLVESMAGRIPEEALEVVLRLSGGSPFMAEAVTRGLFETGAVVEGPEGWRVEPEAMAQAQSSRQAAAFLKRRLKILPPEALRVLSVAAVLGKEFDAELAARLAELRPTQALASLDEARRRNILWARGEEGRFAFVHDKLREALLALLAPAERRSLHGLAAFAIEERDPSRRLELAYHFDAAGESERALPHALAAAEEARAQHAVEVAERQYRIAERGARAAGEDVRFRVAEGLGEMLMLRGRYDEAERRLDEARALARGDRARAAIGGAQGELAFKRGDVARAAAAIERALADLGRPVPRRRAAVFLGALGEVLVQALHTAFPRVFLARRRREDAGADLLAARLYSRLAYAYWFSAGRLRCLWAHLRGLNLAERYPPGPELAQAYSEHAPVMTMIPAFARGLRYAERSLAIRRQVRDLWGQGQSLHFHGVVLYAASRFEECIEKCREAVRLMERTGDLWEVNTASWHMAFALYRLGDLEGAVEAARRVYRAGLEIGDAQARGISLGVWAKASGGRVSRALVQAELERGVDDVHTLAELSQAEAACLLREGRAGEAAAALARAQRAIEAKGFRQEYVASVLPWLASALREQARGISDWSPSARRRLLRRAQRAARKGLRLAERYRNNLPHALRECGLIAAMRGMPGPARRFLDRSIAAAEAQGARYEVAQSLLARGKVGLAQGAPSAPGDVAAAQRLLRELRAGAARDELAAAAAARPATLSLADRFDAVLDVGRSIASGLSPETIFGAVHEAVTALLRAEQCVILHIQWRGEAPELARVAGEGRFARPLVERALAAGRPAVFRDDAPGDADEMLILADVKSALAAPILARGRARACFYVAHRGVTGVFGADEVRLAEYIAAIAGAALENADNFAELRRLADTLELRVAERTAAAESRARELDRSNQELRRFASVASHDLQEPLRKIQVFGDRLVATCGAALGAQGADYVERMRNAARRMQGLIDALLQLSRVTTQVEPFAEVDLGQVARDVLSDLEVRLEQTGGRVEVGDLPGVEADPVQMRQLLQNLIANALKYRRKGVAPVVKVSGRLVPGRAAGRGAGPEDETFCEITVEDNGIGIEEKHFGRIFEVFQRLHGASEHEGAGIGLAICRKIAERHGGAITVRSRVGEGAAFSIAIPRRQGAAPDWPPAAPAMAPPPAADGDPKPGA